jgi:hypothetical protein
MSVLDAAYERTDFRRSIKPVLACMISLSLVACNTGARTNGNLSPAVPSYNSQAAEWQVDSLVARCVASVVGGAIVGGLIGAATGGNRGIGTGAAIGAGAGGVACAVMAALDEHDRARIKEAQIAAARTGTAQELSYVGKDGLQRKISVRPRPVVARKVVPETLVRGSSLPSASPSASQAAVARGERVCRTLDTSASVAGKGEATVPPQVVCRNDVGDWIPSTAIASSETG